MGGGGGDGRVGGLKERSASKDHCFFRFKSVVDHATCYDFSSLLPPPHPSLSPPLPPSPRPSPPLLVGCSFVTDACVKNSIDFQP